ncbi:glycosyltransferase [Candidatus Kaiserbacteria bacterium]|nr:glycosyltransferase [Candidatus Kaiserbacteria bacterium]
MKILYATHARLPTEKAYGAQIVQTCAALSEHAEVTLLVPNRNGATPERIRDAYGISNTFSIHVVDTLDWVQFGRIGFLLSEWFFAREVRRIVQKEKYDVVYSRDALPLLGLPSDVRTVYEAHTPRWNVFIRRVARSVDVFVSITKGLADWYTEKGVTKDIAVIPDAVDLARFENIPDKEVCRRELDIPEDIFMVSYIGHLYPEKGAHILAAAVGHLPEDITCFFVGGLEQNVEDFKKHYTSKQIVYVPHQPHERVPYYMCASDVLVVPNSGKHETSARFTSPMKLFEYMASGRPIVASDVPALREVLSEEMATFFEADNPESLAEAIISAKNDGVEKAEKAKEAVQNYTWQKRAEHIMKIL